jgi:hypothetical protein
MREGVVLRCGNYSSWERNLQPVSMGGASLIAPQYSVTQTGLGRLNGSSFSMVRRLNGEEGLTFNFPIFFAAIN